MTALTWTQTRDQTIDRFQGQTPRPEDEAAIIDAFEAHPAMVLRAIDETADALAQSKVTWAWAVLKSRVERGATAVREATPNTSGERTKRIRNAEAWIHNAGLYLDRASDLEDELFGDRGTLRDYAKDDGLRARLTELWHTERPRGEQAERDHLAWNAACAATRQRIAPRPIAAYDPASDTITATNGDPVTVTATAHEPDADADLSF